MSTDIDQPARFTRPGKTVHEDERIDRIVADREDEPPPGVPRDHNEQPLIVLPDGSGVMAYRRASKYGGRIRDERMIHDWEKRGIVWGMSRKPHLVVSAGSVRTQTAKDDRVKLQDIGQRALTAADADAAAMSGTALHKLSERSDAGEDLTYLGPHPLTVLAAYRRLLDPFEILATEMFVVHDRLGSAGTLDRAVRLPFDLVWSDGVIIPAGTIVIVDVKTGKITSYGYWDTEFTCQQLVYDEGVPYLPGVTVLTDPGKRSAQNVASVTGQPGHHGRITWDEAGVPGGPCHRWALIAHVPYEAPERAQLVRIDLDEARKDAEVARQAWERARVGHGSRFLAMGAALLDRAASLPDNRTMPDELQDNGQTIRDADTALSTAVNPQLVAILRERIYRADSVDMVTEIYDAWGASPSWTDALGDACEEMIDRLIPPASVIDSCEQCNYDRHNCPACGIGVPHGKDCCRACELRLLLDDADDAETMITLWEAHKPESDGGDGLWADEHTQAAQARYDRLSPPDDPRQDGPPETSAVFPGPDDDPAGPARPDYPYTDATGTLWCHECTIDEDPRPWCDCQPDETCMDAAVACRWRAHGPDLCPVRDDSDLSQVEPPEQDEPGPFDGTKPLDDLRHALDEALTTETIDALYEAHKPREDGGDGLWDSECTARAQAAYDRLSPAEVPS